MINLFTLLALTELKGKMEILEGKIRRKEREEMRKKNYIRKKIEKRN